MKLDKHITAQNQNSAINPIIFSSLRLFFNVRIFSQNTQTPVIAYFCLFMLMWICLAHVGLTEYVSVCKLDKNVCVSNIVILHKYKKGLIYTHEITKTVCGQI